MSESPSVVFTSHAIYVMTERMIPREWIERVVTAPASRLPDPYDSEVERFFGAISEYDNRVLRVVVNTRVVPWRVVSVFFDRNMRDLA